MPLENGELTADMMRRLLAAVAVVAACTAAAAAAGKLHLLKPSAAKASKAERTQLNGEVKAWYAQLVEAFTSGAEPGSVGEALSSMDPPTESGFGWKWWDKLASSGSVFDRHRPGRPAMFSKEQVQAVADAIVERTQNNPDQAMCGSVSTMDRCLQLPEALELLAASGAAPKTLANHLRTDANISLSVTVEHKRPHDDPGNANDRVEACVRWLDYWVRPDVPGVTTPTLSELQGGPPEGQKVHRPPAEHTHEYSLMWLRRHAPYIVFIDEKSFEVCPQTWKVFGVGGQVTINDPRCETSNRWKLKYYAAVCGELGGVHIKLVTGTAGKDYTHPGPPEDPAGPWLVSHRSSQAGLVL